MIPFSPTLLRVKESMASRNFSSLPSVSPLTSTSSKVMGTLMASKTSLTLSASSLPIPSPGIKVTWNLPIYQYRNYNQIPSTPKI